MNANADQSAKLETAPADVQAWGALSQEDARQVQSLQHDLVRRVCVAVVGPQISDLDTVVELLLGARIPGLATLPRDVVISHSDVPTLRLTARTGAQTEISWTAFEALPECEARFVYAELSLPIAALKSLTLVRGYVPLHPDMVPLAAQWIDGIADFAIFAAPHWNGDAHGYCAELSTKLIDHSIYLNLGGPEASCPESGQFKSTIGADVEMAARARFADEVDVTGFEASGAVALVSQLKQSIERARQQAADQLALLLDRFAREGIYDDIILKKAQQKPQATPLAQLDIQPPPSVHPGFADDDAAVAILEDEAPHVDAGPDALVGQMHQQERAETELNTDALAADETDTATMAAPDGEERPIEDAKDFGEPDQDITADQADAPEQEHAADAGEPAPAKKRPNPQKAIRLLNGAVDHLVHAAKMMRRALEQDNAAKQIQIAYAAVADVAEDLRDERLGAAADSALLSMASEAEEVLVNFAVGHADFAIADSVAILLQLKRSLQAEIAQIQVSQTPENAEPLSEGQPEQEIPQSECVL